MTGEQYRRYPKSLLMRQVTVDARDRDNRAERFKVITTILDASVDGVQIGDLYERRWSGEIDNQSSVRIGWLDGGRVYLDANEAARLTQAFAAQQNKPLSNPDTVVARLAEKGWLAVERTGGTTRYKTRKTLEGARRTNLLAFDALVFWPPDGQGRD